MLHRFESRTGRCHVSVRNEPIRHHHRIVTQVDQRYNFKKLDEIYRAVKSATVFNLGLTDQLLLLQVQKILEISVAVVTLMDKFGVSVLLALEDGSNFTAQISSLIQLLSDKEYRTTKG
eukprot:sb/3476372/